MKTLLQSLPNQFLQTTKVAFIGLGILIPQASFSSLPENQSIGLFQSLEAEILRNKSEFQKFLKETDKNSKVLIEPSTVKNIRIHPDFMRSILLNTNQKYLTLLNKNKDQCSLYSLLENNLLRTATGEIKDVVYYYKDKKNKESLVKTSRETLIGLIHQVKCPKFSDLSQMFEQENIAKTMKGFDFQTPKTTSECESIHNDWIQNEYTPYLCSISEKEGIAERASKILKTLPASQNYKKKFFEEKISEYSFYKNNISFFNRSFIKNACNSLADTQLFCDKYLAKDIWSKILNGEKPAYFLSYKCKSARGKKQAIQSRLISMCREI